MTKKYKKYVDVTFNETILFQIRKGRLELDLPLELKKLGKIIKAGMTATAPPDGAVKMRTVDDRVELVAKSKVLSAKLINDVEIKILPGFNIKESCTLSLDTPDTYARLEYEASDEGKVFNGELKIEFEGPFPMRSVMEHIHGIVLELTGGLNQKNTNTPNSDEVEGTKEAKVAVKATAPRKRAPRARTKPVAKKAAPKRRAASK